MIQGASRDHFPSIFTRGGFEDYIEMVGEGLHGNVPQLCSVLGCMGNRCGDVLKTCFFGVFGMVYFWDVWSIGA